MKKIILILTQILAGCSLALQGPPSGWEMEEDADRLRFLAQSNQCSTSSRSTLVDGVLGGWITGVGALQLVTGEQLGESTVADDQVRGYGAATMALGLPFLFSARTGKRKIDDCKAFHKKLVDTLGPSR